MEKNNTKNNTKNDTKKPTRVSLLLPIMLQGANKDQLSKLGIVAYKKNNFKVENGCVLRHSLNILRDIKNERKGHWSKYKDISKNDTIKIELKTGQ